MNMSPDTLGDNFQNHLKRHSLELFRGRGDKCGDVVDYIDKSLDKLFELGWIAYRINHFHLFRERWIQTKN